MEQQNIAFQQIMRTTNFLIFGVSPSTSAGSTALGITSLARQ